MADQTIQAKTLANGLVVIVEPMAGVRSAAFSVLLPAGSVFDPPGKNAAAAVLCEMLPRGAGSRDSRELSNALDDLGVQRDESVGVAHLSLSGAMIADNLKPRCGSIVICSASRIYQRMSSKRLRQASARRSAETKTSRARRS